MKLAIKRLDSRQGAKHAKFRRKDKIILKKLFIIIFRSLRPWRLCGRYSEFHLLALPCQNADHGYAPDKLPTALDTTLADSEGSCDAPSHADFPRRLIQYQGWKLQKKVGLFVVSCR